MTTKDHILSAIRSKRPDFSKLGIRDIGLFGSYVREEQSNKSDIDILVDFESDKENYDNYMAVCDMIERMFQNEKVDIVTKNGLSPYLGPRILSEVQFA